MNIHIERLDMISQTSASDLRHELEALRTLSARLGSDPLLTQAAGGNTSIKDGDTLWIKASGTWLAHALERDIFVPVRMAPLLRAVAESDPAAEQAHRFSIEDLNPSGLRPSIETTVHALMPQRVVLHVHCVDTIALAVRIDGEAVVGERLAGLNWTWIPYRRPGLPLALAISQRSSTRPDVLVLGNHGLVVAAETVADAEALLTRVKGLLQRTPRASAEADLAFLEAAARTSGYRLPTDPAAHRAATDKAAATFAAAGTLYPDHVIFLGVGSVVAGEDETVSDVVTRAGSEPAAILFPGRGVLMRADAGAGADAMARCLADVLMRVPEAAALQYLSASENRELTDWDAEQYRQRLNKTGAQT